MPPFLIGNWEAERSDIPRYVPHREWLRFRESGTHLIEQWHPGQDVKSVQIAFTLEEEENGAFRFRPTKPWPDGFVQDGWRVSIVNVDADLIAVTPHLPGHGFTTIYRRLP